MMTKVIPDGVCLTPDARGKYHLLYLILRDNGMEYFGVHSTRRPFDHYVGGGMALKAAIRKHGRSAFTQYLLASFPSRDKALGAEALIVTPEYVGQNNTYNLIKGGRSTAEEHLLSTRQKQSLAHMGRPKSREAVMKSARSKTGTPHTAETRAKISLGGRGQVRSAQTRQRLAESKRGVSRSLEAVCSYTFTKFGVLYTPEQLLAHRAAKALRREWRDRYPRSLDTRVVRNLCAQAGVNSLL